MITVYNMNTDPHFNLAAEEYFLKNTAEDVFMLWQNGPSVIIGKSQNTWAEVDIDYAQENNIKIARRITGGGAVFHDLGNVNFSFITDADEDSRLNFEKFTAPVIKALEKVGVAASLDGRNDLVADGYKISGNAQCVAKAKNGKDRILHHGTLLFAADMGALQRVLKVSDKKFASKGIKSVSSRVKNITELEGYKGPCCAKDFITHLLCEIGGSSARALSEGETEKIKELAEEKFSRWEWNFGESPSFETVKEERFPFGTLTVMLKSCGGKIEDIRFYGDFFGNGDTSSVEKALCGCRYEYKSVFERLCLVEQEIKSSIIGAKPSDVAKLLFSEN